MIVDPIRSAFEHIDEDAPDEFRDGLHARLLAELLGDDATGDDQGDITNLHPLVDRPGGGRTARRWWLAAAVIVAVLAIGLFVFNTVGDPSSVRTDTVPLTPAPSIDPATTSLLPAVDSLPATLPATTTPVTTTTGTVASPVLNGWAAVASEVSDGTSDIYLVREGDAPHRLVVEGSDTASELCPAFSPDGERLIFWMGFGNPSTWYHDGQLVVVTVVDDGSVTSLTTVPLDSGIDPTCATWAPDGQWIAFADGDTVAVADTATGEVRHILTYRPSDLEWRPGTDELAIAGKIETVEEMLGWSNGPLIVYTVSTGQTRQVGDLEVRDIAWSPDGDTLAYTQYFMEGGGTELTSGISLIDADGSNPRPLTTTEHRAYRSSEVTIQWSPRGDLIAYGRPCDACGKALDTEIVLVTAADDDPANPIGTETILASAVTETASGSSEWSPASFSWAPDGTRLLYESPGGFVIVPIDSGQPPQQLTDDSDFNPATVSFSPDLRTQQWGRE